MSTPANQLPAQGAGLTREDIVAAVRAAMPTNGGDNSAKMQEILSDNFTYRHKIQDLTTQISTLTAKVPVDGAIVLTGDDAKAYNEFIALKLKPAEVTALQSKVTELEKSADAFLLEKNLRAAAAAENYDPTVLGTLVNGKDLLTKPTDVEKDGKTVKVDRAYIQIKDTGGVVTERLLSDFVTEKHPKFLPSLTVGEQEEGNRSLGSGTSYLPQRGVSAGPKGDQPSPAKAFLKRKYGQQAEQGKA